MKKTMRDAIREAMAEELRRDPNVFLIGEDIGIYGGTLKVTDGLYAEFGPERVIDTPISENAITGAAIGAAMMGMRPVLELMFGDFLYLPPTNYAITRPKCAMHMTEKCLFQWSHEPPMAAVPGPVCTIARTLRRSLPSAPA